MSDTSKITLKQLKDAMNMVKDYIDAEIRAINVDNTIPCTGIVLDKDTLSFTTTNTQILVATVTPDNCTQSVTWSVSPAGIATVNNGVVTPVANGSCTITATCGSHSATCAVTVSNMAAPSPALYELAEAKTFNGTSDYLDTGLALLSQDNLDKDWTILIDFTPTKLAQCSIIHCMTESSPWPGMYLSLMATGGIQMIFPNGAANNNIKTVAANQRFKFVIKKVGNTFTIYDSTMSSLHTATTSAITTTDNTLLVGAIQVYNTTQHTMTYSRYFTGTVHKFKIVEGDMSSSECLNWMA